MAVSIPDQNTARVAIKKHGPKSSLLSKLNVSFSENRLNITLLALDITLFRAVKKSVMYRKSIAYDVITQLRIFYKSIYKKGGRGNNNNE